jgi:hypothetical protein
LFSQVADGLKQIKCNKKEILFSQVADGLKQIKCNKKESSAQFVSNQIHVQKFLKTEDYCESAAAEKEEERHITTPKFYTIEEGSRNQRKKNKKQNPTSTALDRELQTSLGSTKSLDC